MAVTAGQALTVLGDQFASEGLDRGRWLRLSKQLDAFPRADRPGQRAMFNAVGGAALALAAGLPWLSLPEIGPAVTALLALRPHPLSDVPPEPLATVLRQAAGAQSIHGLLLPGGTLGAALAGLIEALAGPMGRDLGRELAVGGFCVRVSAFPPPFGLVAAVSVAGVTQLYTARAAVMDDHGGRCRIVPSVSLDLEVFATMAPLLSSQPVMEKMAA